MKKILVVEDDEMMVLTYKSWFESSIKPSSDILVQFCKDGREASYLLKMFNYDMTFLDLALPNISGPDLVSLYLKNMGRLVVASSYPEASKSTCDKAQRVLTKPFNSSELLSEVETMSKGANYAKP